MLSLITPIKDLAAGLIAFFTAYYALASLLYMVIRHQIPQYKHSVIVSKTAACFVTGVCFSYISPRYVIVSFWDFALIMFIVLITNYNRKGTIDYDL